MAAAARKSIRPQSQRSKTQQDPNAGPTPEEDPNNPNVTPEEDPNNPANDDADGDDDTVTESDDDSDPNDDEDDEDEEVEKPRHQYAQHTNMLEDVDEDEDGIPDWLQVDNAPTDGIILSPDDPLRVEGEVTEDETGIRISKNIYRAFRPMGSKRWGFMLEYPAGHVIPKTMVQQIQK